MEQLFLLEVLVDTIYFQSVAMVPQKKQLNIVATFGNLVTLEIRTDNLGALEHISENKRKDMEINLGKSYLFFAKPSDLLNALKKCPLEVVLSTKASPVPIGNATIQWESDFDYMVSSCNNNVGYMTPAFQAKLYKLRHKDLIIGDIDLFVRLSCFGKSISTNLQIVKPPKDVMDGAPASTKFLLKSANAATTYECQIYGMGTSQEFLPIAPIYQSADLVQLSGLKSVGRERSSETLTNESRVPSAFVMDMPVRDFNPIDLKNLADLLTGHRESIIVRPNELQFANLEQLMGVQMERLSADEISREQRNLDSTSLDLIDLTVEKIENQLCKNKNCPAARLFKEYGIGPLATGKALGTVFNRDDVKVHTTYGMSQTFGRADRYGPFGLYSRPKRPDQPFIPRNSHSSMHKSISDGSSNSSIKCKKACKHSCSKLKGGQAKEILIRLRGGGLNQQTTREILKSFKEESLKTREEFEIQELGNRNVDNEKENFCRYMSKIVRLRAGGKIDDEEDNSPMSKCRELMQEFDKVVSAYKKALGPCGKAICPFAQNVVIENCRKSCPGAGYRSAPTTSEVDDTSSSLTGTSCPGPEDDMSACGNETCEYRRRDDTPVAEEFKNSQPKSACGDPTCTYIGQRLGFPGEEDDGGIKLHDLPKNCGGPKCPYTAMDPLPPIHWDCPDPLPKGGICRNRDCPITKKQHIIDCSFKAPKPPCGQVTCPYAPPPPCDFQGCPFGPLIDPCPSFCPYKRDPCPRKCPFALEYPKDPCQDPTCPYNQAAAGMSPDMGDRASTPGGVGECYHNAGQSPDQHCGNPDCPYNAVGGGFDADDEADDDLIPCNADTCKATSGGPYECDHCVVVKGRAKDSCECAKNNGRGQGDRSGGREDGKLQHQQGKGPHMGGRSGDVQQVIKGAPRRGSKDVEPVIEKKDINQGHNYNNENKNHIGSNFAQNNDPTSMPENQQRPINPPSNQQQHPANPQYDNSQPQSKNATAPSSVAPNSGRRKRKRRSQFVYDEGDIYPGIHVGHKYCNVPTMNVPKNMGWLWNIKSHVGRLKPRRGWRPGAISKTIAARIETHRRLLGILPPASQKPSKRRMKKKKDGTYGAYESESEEDMAPKPTLQVKKKDGCYWITMNPLKDPATLEENENPYIDCTPMQFKIAKNTAQEEKEDRSCFCDDDGTVIVAVPEDSDSELDIEFTPPAGIIHPDRHRRKKNIVHIDTQYDMNDFLPPSLQLDANKSSEAGKGAKKKGKGGKKGRKGGKGGDKKKKKKK